MNGTIQGFWLDFAYIDKASKEQRIEYVITNMKFSYGLQMEKGRKEKKQIIFHPGIYREDHGFMFNMAILREYSAELFAARKFNDCYIMENRFNFGNMTRKLFNISWIFYKRHKIENEETIRKLFEDFEKRNVPLNNIIPILEMEVVGNKLTDEEMAIEHHYLSQVRDVPVPTTHAGIERELALDKFIHGD